MNICNAVQVMHSAWIISPHIPALKLSNSSTLPNLQCYGRPDDSFHSITSRVYESTPRDPPPHLPLSPLSLGHPPEVNVFLLQLAPPPPLAPRSPPSGEVPLRYIPTSIRLSMLFATTFSGPICAAHARATTKPRRSRCAEALLCRVWADSPL